MAASSETEVVVFTWLVPGTNWQTYSCLRHSVSSRRVCAVVPLALALDIEDGCHEQDTHEAHDTPLGAAFVVGLGISIVTADRAEMSEVESKKLESAAPYDRAQNASASRSSSDFANDVLDLRGRIGTQDSARNLLDLQNDLDIVRNIGPASVRQTLSSETGEGSLFLGMATPHGVSPLSKTWPLQHCNQT